MSSRNEQLSSGREQALYLQNTKRSKRKFEITAYNISEWVQNHSKINFELEYFVIADETHTL
jgi:hypothetical protein